MTTLHERPETQRDRLLASIMTACSETRLAVGALTIHLTVIEWEVGETADGLPFLVGRVDDRHPVSSEFSLRHFAQYRPLRRIVFDDPARVSVEYTWPEPTIDEARLPAVAWVSLWAPATESRWAA